MSLDTGIRNILSDIAIIRNDIDDLEIDIATKQDTLGALTTINVNEVKANTITLAGTKIINRLAAKQDIITVETDLIVKSLMLGNENILDLVPSGPTGPTGADGINGVNGAQGETGPAGAAGIDGVDGINGAQGETGAAGAAGIDGVDGISGVDGINGVNGAQG